MAKERMSQKNWKKTLKKFAKLPPPELERKAACFHEHLNKVVKDDLIYQCFECKTIIIIVGSVLYEPTSYLQLCLQVAEYLGQNSEADTNRGVEVEPEEGSVDCDHNGHWMGSDKVGYYCAICGITTNTKPEGME